MLDRFVDFVFGTEVAFLSWRIEVVVELSADLGALTRDLGALELERLT